jgi:BirA family biotin operon repressor/biotin-[acetyl-CoA-carboxylase] ligase
MIIRKLSNEIRDYEEIGSTNEEMNRLIMTEDLAEGTIVRTAYQHAGKGHEGNSWQSERGQNLLFSMLLKPDFLYPENAFHLSRITSLSLHEVIDSQCDDVQIKWPNDMLVGDRKMAGILIENMIVSHTISHSVLGIGINVNQTTFDPSLPAPTSMKIEKGCHIDMNSLLGKFRSSMERWYNTLITGNERIIMESYNRRLYRLGLTAYYRSAAGKFTAIIRDVRPSGELVLESGKGDILTFGFKEVKYLGIIPPDHN